MLMTLDLLFFAKVVDFVLAGSSLRIRCHPFHMVDFSPWPSTGSTGTLFLTSDAPLQHEENILRKSDRKR